MEMKWLKKICSERREGAEVNPYDDSGSDCDCPEENVEEVHEPSTLRTWCMVMGESNSDVVLVVMIGGEESKDKVPMKNRYVAIHFYTFLMFCEILF